MAFADFFVTDFGAQWLAQAVEDAQQGTSKAVLTAMRFGLGSTAEPPTMQTLWHEDTTSLEVWSGGNAIGIRGIATNLGDTAAHDLDYIEVTGSNDGTSGIVCYAKSEEVESIPPASEQQIARTATVSLAVSGDAAVTLATPQTGYAIEESTAKLSPLINRDDLIVQKSVTSVGKTKTCTVKTAAGHYTGVMVATEQTAGTPETNAYHFVNVGADRIGFGAGANFEDAVAHAPFIQRDDAHGEALAVHASGGLTLDCEVKASGNITTDSDVHAEDGIFSGDLGAANAVITGIMGGSSAVAQAQNIPAVIVRDGSDTFTVFSTDAAKTEGVAEASIWSTAHVSSPAFSGVVVAFTSGGVEVRRVTAGSFSAPANVILALAFRY